MRNKKAVEHISKITGVRSSRSLEAVMKAQLISSILHAASKKKLTHVELASRSKLPRSAVTGILSGSLQKVTIDRILKLVEAVGLKAEVRITNSAA